MVTGGSHGDASRVERDAGGSPGGGRRRRRRGVPRRGCAPGGAGACWGVTARGRLSTGSVVVSGDPMEATMVDARQQERGARCLVALVDGQPGPQGVGHHGKCPARPPRSQPSRVIGQGPLTKSETMGDVATAREKAAVARDSVAIGYRAAELGHQLEVQRDGKRFRVVCECGFRTPLNSTRKAAFGSAYDHAVAAANSGVSVADVGPFRQGLPPR